MKNNALNHIFVYVRIYLNRMILYEIVLPFDKWVQGVKAD